MSDVTDIAARLRREVNGDSCVHTLHTVHYIRIGAREKPKNVFRATPTGVRVRRNVYAPDALIPRRNDSDRINGKYNRKTYIINNRRPAAVAPRR